MRGPTKDTSHTLDGPNWFIKSRKQQKPQLSPVYPHASTASKEGYGPLCGPDVHIAILNELPASRAAI